MPKKSSPTKTIMHVDLDAFFASVEEALDPALRNKPVIIGGNPKTRGVVACPNYTARNRGVKTAMPLYQAYRLAPDAVFLQGSYQRYQEFSEQFFRILNRYTDTIEPLSLDEAFIDLTGFDDHYISPEQAAHSIRQDIQRELEITASVGIASNKVTAKVASETKKPNAVVYVPRGKEAVFLAPLPIRQLPGIGPRTAAYLGREHITTIGELASLSANKIIHLFGQQGYRLWQLANGQDDSEVTAPGKAKSISRSTTFPFDTADTALIKSTMFFLLEQICKTLRDRDAYGHTLVVKIRTHDFTTRTKQCRLAQGTNQSYDCYRPAVALLQDILTHSSDIRLVGVAMHDLESHTHQTTLFDNSFTKLKQIQQAVDTIRNRFGFTAMHSGRTIKYADVYRTKHFARDTAYA